MNFKSTVVLYAVRRVLISPLAPLGGALRPSAPVDRSSAPRCRRPWSETVRSLAASTERLLCHEADIGRLQSTLPWQREKSPVGVQSSCRAGAASQRQDRRCAPDSAGFAIGRHPPPIAEFLGLKNKLSLQGLAGEVLTICKRGCYTGAQRLHGPSSVTRLRHLSVRGDRDHQGQAVPAPSQRTPNRR